MPVCKFCKEDDETPSDARRISKGQDCVRCGMTYNQERAELNDGPTLYDFQEETDE